MFWGPKNILASDISLANSYQGFYPIKLTLFSELSSSFCYQNFLLFELIFPEMVNSMLFTCAVTQQ